MKRIINRKTYNTKTAQAVAYWEQGGTDFSATEETLYVTKKGNWFVHGCGGPRSEYAVWLNHSSVRGGSKIWPLSGESEVLEWVEEHGIDPDCLNGYIETEEA